METLPGAASKQWPKPAHSTERSARWVLGVPEYCRVLASNFDIHGSHCHKDFNLLCWVFWVSAGFVFKTLACLPNAGTLHRITLSSDARATPSDSLSFSLLPYLALFQLTFPHPCFPAHQPRRQVLLTSASHGHPHFSSTPKVRPSMLFASPEPGVSPGAQLSTCDGSSVLPPPRMILTSWFTSEKALAGKVSEGSYQPVILFIMYFWQQTFSKSHVCLPGKVRGEPANVEPAPEFLPSVLRQRVRFSKS